MQQILPANKNRSSHCQLPHINLAYGPDDRSFKLTDAMVTRPRRAVEEQKGGGNRGRSMRVCLLAVGQHAAAGP